MSAKYSAEDVYGDGELFLFRDGSKTLLAEFYCAEAIKDVLRAVNSHDALVAERDMLQQHCAQWARGNLIRERESLTDYIARAAMVKALEAMVERYVGLANSGDCGFWDPETEEEVIAARAALALAVSSDNEKSEA
jgi:hypothetical protein